MLFDDQAKRVEIASGIEAELSKLGAADAIAKLFTEKKVTGIPVSSRSCPVAKWLKAYLVTIFGKESFECTVGVTSGSLWQGPTRQMFDVPESIGDFIRRFDQHEFAHLISD